MIGPREGMQAFDRDAAQQTRFLDVWVRAPEPAEATGGSVVDIEARMALNSLVETLRIAGILPTQKIGTISQFGH